MFSKFQRDCYFLQAFISLHSQIQSLYFPFSRMSSKRSKKALKKKIDASAEQEALMRSSRIQQVEKLADEDIFVVDTEGMFATI